MSANIIHIFQVNNQKAGTESMEKQKNIKHIKNKGRTDERWRAIRQTEKNDQITTNTVWLQMNDTQLEIMYMCTKKKIRPESSE